MHLEIAAFRLVAVNEFKALALFDSFIAVIHETSR